MHIINKVPIVLLFIYLFEFAYICSAQEYLLFQGEVNADNINIRSDSTVNSEVICKINKSDRIEVIQELYDWYKIKLPKNAPAFIKKNLVIIVDNKTAKVASKRVNIRLRPNESSPIIGMVEQGELISVLKDEGQWYKIKPVDHNFGWIHKKFVSKVIPIAKPAVKIEETTLAQKTVEENKLLGQAATLDENNIILEGILKPKIMKRIATHKLITQEKKVFLLKGNIENLNALNYHKVRVTGQLINSAEHTYTVIEIIKLEGIN